MLDKIKQSVFNSRLLQYLLVSVVSAGLALILYPTKHIEEREHSKYEQELKTLTKGWEEIIKEKGSKEITENPKELLEKKEGAEKETAVEPEPALEIKEKNRGVELSLERLRKPSPSAYHPRAVGLSMAQSLERGS